MTHGSKPQFKIGSAAIPRFPGILRSALARIAGLTSLTLTLVLAFPTSGRAQDSLPFAVSNPQHQKWAMEEAGRIYMSACALVARTVRPERPPHLHPAFVLVLGTRDDETVRSGTVSEIHLKTWNPARFAEAVVIMASRDVVNNDALISLTRETLMAAESSVSVSELKEKR
jgi:hypothetical protein